jgi:hypothetical protein
MSQENVETLRFRGRPDRGYDDAREWMRDIRDTDRDEALEAAGLQE